ncbi:MAG: flavodoxin family protein [Promethearchaeota archaeon]
MEIKIKVLTIMGGPRKGYGTIVMEQLERELKTLSNEIEFKYLYLKDVNLERCRGCLNCFFDGEDSCPFRNDDRDKILHKINESDGIIFMAPAYALHIPALMKNFFDRCAYIFHRPCFFGKIAIGVCNQGITGAKAITSYFNEVAHSWGFNYVASLELLTQPGREKKIVKKIRKTCRVFIKALQEKKYQKPTYGSVIGFKLRVLLHRIVNDEKNADYAFWFEQGWLDDGKKYFVDVRVGLMKRLVAGFIGKLAQKSFRKMFMDGSEVAYNQFRKLESLKFS